MGVDLVLDLFFYYDIIRLKYVKTVNILTMAKRVVVLFCIALFAPIVGMLFAGYMEAMIIPSLLSILLAGVLATIKWKLKHRVSVKKVTPLTAEI
jgi:hypothetical protein